MKKRAQGFNTAAQDSNPGSRSRESEALPLSHCALVVKWVDLTLPDRVVLNLFNLFQPMHLILCQVGNPLFRALCRIKLLPVTRFGGRMDVNC